MAIIRADGVDFNAQDYLEDPVVFQPAILDARSNYGFALCLCSAPPRQLVIREVKGVAYLAVWPNDGSNHDPSCEFHREHLAADDQNDQNPPSEAGANVKPAARCLPDGHWDLSLDLPRIPSAQQPNRVRATKAGEPTSSESTGRNQFSMSEFLAWLWENANFNRWGKGWRRDWARVATQIRRDAEHLYVDSHEPFVQSLYVPPPFRKDEEAVIHAQWERFAQPLIAYAEPGRRRRRGFVLAEVKAFDRTGYGFRVLSRNMARPLFVDDHLHAALAKASPLALALLPKSKELGCAVVGLWAIEATGRGNFRAIAGALMLVNSRYIPVNTTAELQIANVLCVDDRTFIKGVGRFAGADFVIREGGQNHALLVYSLNSPDYISKRDLVAKRCESVGCRVWTWNITQAKMMPALPTTA